MIVKTTQRPERVFSPERAARRRVISAAKTLTTDDLQYRLVRWVDDDLSRRCVSLPILSPAIDDTVRDFESFMNAQWDAPEKDGANDLYRDSWERAILARAMVKNTLWWVLRGKDRLLPNAFAVEIERRLLLLSPLIDLLAPNAPDSGGRWAYLSAFLRYVRRAYDTPQRRERVYDLVADQTLRTK